MSVRDAMAHVPVNIEYLCHGFVIKSEKKFKYVIPLMIKWLIVTYYWIGEFFDECTNDVVISLCRDFIVKQKKCSEGSSGVAICWKSMKETKNIHEIKWTFHLKSVHRNWMLSMKKIVFYIVRDKYIKNVSDFCGILSESKLWQNKKESKKKFVQFDVWDAWLKHYEEEGAEWWNMSNKDNINSEIMCITLDITNATVYCECIDNIFVSSRKLCAKFSQSRYQGGYKIAVSLHNIGDQLTLLSVEKK